LTIGKLSRREAEMGEEGIPREGKGGFRCRGETCTVEKVFSGRKKGDRSQGHGSEASGGVTKSLGTGGGDLCALPSGPESKNARVIVFRVAEKGRSPRTQRGVCPIIYDRAEEHLQ